MNVTAEEILDRAVEVINDSGWQRDMTGPPNRGGPHCVLGAIYQASNELGISWSNDNDPWIVIRQRAILAFNLGLRENVGNGTHAVNWNDHIARDADEVVDALKRAKEHL